MSRSQLEKQLETRAGQCILTCPTTALFSGLDGEDMIPLGKNLKYFGDGYQISKRIDKKRFWRIPVMDGEFMCEEMITYPGNWWWCTYFYQKIDLHVFQHVK